MPPPIAIPILHETGAVINHRYTVQQRLGAGAMGEVYLVTDAERHDIPVAMKYLLGQTDAALERFKREFSTLAHLHHPNITAVYDLALDRAHRVHFFTTEYVIGKPFDQAAQHLPHAQIVELFVQALRALAYLHGHGLLHYDIKGANVLVAIPDDGALQVKLIDFGVADQGWQGKRRGTPSYMAPEIVDARSGDHRADLYSLGVLMYVTLTNWNPFRGSTREITYDRHRTFVPPPPSARNPAIPAYLDQVILRLLEKRPDDRYADAVDVIQDLNRLGPIQHAIETPDTLHSYIPEHGPFIGRELERTLLEAQLVAPRDGTAPQQPCSWIRGGRGTGKTRLLREAKWMAQLHDYTTYFIDPAQPHAADELQMAVRTALYNSPDQRLWIGIDNADTAPDDPRWPALLQQLRLHIHDALPQHFLSSTTAYYPLVLVLASADTVEAIDLVAQRYAVTPADAATIALAHFSRDELAQYLAICTGLAAVPVPLVHTMWRYSEGNPFFITELLKTLIHDGRLFDSAGRWHATTFDDLGVQLDALRIPESLVALVAERYRHLTPEQQTILTLMAVWAHPTPLAQLSQVIGAPIEAHALAPLAQSGFISFDPTARCYTFRVETYRHAIYQLLSDAERRRWHDRLTHWYTQHTGGALHQWTHQTNGSDPTLARRANWRLALCAAHHERPHEALRHTHALLPEAYHAHADERAAAAPDFAYLPAALLHARMLGHIQQPAAALAFLEPLLAHASTPAEQLPLHEAIALSADRVRDFARADAALAAAQTARAALATHSGPDDAIALRLDNFAAELHLRRSHDADALATAVRRYRANAAAAAQLAPTARLRVLNNELGRVLFQHGNYTDAIHELQHTSGWLLAQGLDAHAIRPLYYLAEAYRNTHKLADAQNTCRRALDIATAHHTPDLLMYLYQSLGAIEEAMGRIPEAITALTRSLDLCQRLGALHRTLQLSVPLNLGILHRRAGDHKVAEHYLLSSLGYYHQHAGTSGIDAPYACSAHLELAELYRLTHRFALAHTHIDLAEAFATEHDTCRQLQFYIVTTKLEIHRDAGETEQARRLAPRMRELATNTNLLHTASEVESSILDDTTVG